MKRIIQTQGGCYLADSKTSKRVILVGQESEATRYSKNKAENLNEKFNGTLKLIKVAA